MAETNGSSNTLVLGLVLMGVVFCFGLVVGSWVTLIVTGG